MSIHVIHLREEEYQVWLNDTRDERIARLQAENATQALRIRELEAATRKHLAAIADWQRSLWSPDPTTAEPRATQALKLAQDELAALLLAPPPAAEPETGTPVLSVIEKVTEARKQLRSTQLNWREDCLFECDKILTGIIDAAPMGRKP